MKLHLDLESRSTVNLTQTGVYVYAEDPSTEITHVGWAIDDDAVEVWLPNPRYARVATTVQTIDGAPVRVYGGPMPDMLRAALDDPDVIIGAHNAGLERRMLADDPGFQIGLVEIPVSRFDCTAARAARVGLPRSLEGAAGALNLPVRKDRDGHALMMRMCKPLRSTKTDSSVRWLDDDASMIREAAYCAHDVIVERAVDKQVPRLSEFERRVWELTETANDRGVLVDAELLLRVSFMVEDAEGDINRRLAIETCSVWGTCPNGHACPSPCGAVQRVSDHGAITRWLQAFDADDDLGAGGVGKAALAAMLEREDLPPVVRTVLLMRQAGGKSSASKYRSIMKRMSRDGRIRGVLVYCGAAATGRWSSRGAQLHNLPRAGLLKKYAHVEQAIRDIRDGATLAEIEELHGPPMVVASELLRPVFIAPDGHKLARGDSKQIEARILPWLAGAQWKLDAFAHYDAGLGPDLYKVGAGGIFKVDPASIGDDDPRRQIGKVSELALGYQGAEGALQAMAKGYGLKIPRASCPPGVKPWEWDPPDGTDAWIVRKWRPANPEVSDRETGLWSCVERAAITCMESSPGALQRVAGRAGELGVGFIRNGKAMAMRLPSGGSLLYWSPVLRTQVMPWGKPKLCVVYRAEDSQTKQWSEFSGYGGLWVENLDQATGRDLMAYWLLEMAAAGLPPVLTVHDEGIGETDRDDGAAAVEAIMRRLPPWAAGLPVAADSSSAVRYVKA